MLPAGPLMIEHRLIERMISAMDRGMREIEQGGAPDTVFLDTAVDFLRTYADRCHHGKEEDILFVKLASKPMSPPMKQAMERLKADHVVARGLVGRLREQTDRFRAGDGSAKNVIISTLAEIVRLYPDHIAREDKVFFPAAMTYLTKEESEEMLERFEDFDSRLIHERYRTIVEGVEKR